MWKCQDFKFNLHDEEITKNSANIMKFSLIITPHTFLIWTIFVWKIKIWIIFCVLQWSMLFSQLSSWEIIASLFILLRIEAVKTQKNKEKRDFFDFFKRIYWEFELIWLLTLSENCLLVFKNVGNIKDY